MHRGVGIPIGATPVKTIALAFIIGSLLIPLTQTLVHGSAGPSLTNTTVTVTLAFRPTDFTFDTIDGYDRVTTASGGLTTAVGAPMLPICTLRVALPSGLQATHVSIVTVQEQTLSGTYTMMPAQPPRTLNDNQNITFIPPDLAIYQSSTPYPTTTVQLNGESDLAGQAMAQITVYPLHYIGATHTLTLITSLTLTIQGTPGHIYGDYLSTSLSATSRQQLISQVQQTVVNPDAVQLQTNPRPHTTGVPSGRYDYVIITSAAWAADFQPLADWKTQKGVPATIVTTDWIYNDGGYNGTNVSKIRAFVQDAYTTWGTIYVLIGGDTGTVPCNTQSFPFVDSDPVPNDTYYADFDADYVCEVNVGRASVTGPGTGNGQIGTFINKTMTYEKNPPVGYTLNASMFGFDLDAHTHAEQCKITIDNTYIPSSWTMTNVYDSNSGNHKTNVVAALNAGQNLINHADHSGSDCMGTGYINHDWLIYSSDMDNLNNGDKQGILYSMGCDPCAYDDSDCIAEHYVRNTHGGGIAFIGNSRYGWYMPGSQDSYSLGFDIAFFNSLFGQGYYNLGQAFSNHKNDAVTNDDYDRYIYTELTLLGDPELPVWTANPSSFIVTYHSTLPVNSSFFTVHVTSGGTPVNQSLVCLWKGSEVYLTGYTNATGDATFTPSPTTIGTMNITVTKQNYLPHVSTATVANTSDVPPAAEDDNASVLEDSANNQINVLANDHDDDGDTITIINVTQPAYGQTSTDGALAYYTPTGYYSGIDSFNYTITDGYGGYDNATVNITVIAVNHPPIARNYTLTLYENAPETPIPVLSNDTDPDGDNVTITNVTQPAHGTSRENESVAFYTPTPNYSGPDDFNYTISDSHNGTGTATVFITIIWLNQQPVAVNDSFTILQGSTNNHFNVKSNDYDVDNDTLTILSVTTPAHGNATINDSTILYTPLSSYVGTDSFHYTISDGNNGSSNATVTVHITSSGGTDQSGGDGAPSSGSTNHPPRANLSRGEPYHGFVDEPVRFDGSRSSDPDGNITDYVWDFGDATNESGMVVTHVYTKAGVYLVTLTVTDNENVTNMTRTQCTIRQPNRSPTAPLVNGTLVGEKNTRYDFTVLGADPDNDTIRYRFTWGDGTAETITGFVRNHTAMSVNHTWTAANVYSVSARTEDEYGAISPPTSFLVMIDVDVVFLNGTLHGYLIDVNKTSVFSLFHDNASGSTVSVTRQGSGTYLIDTNGDGVAEYTYTSAQGLVPYQPSKTGTPGFETLSAITACLALVLIMHWRRSKRR